MPGVTLHLVLADRVVDYWRRGGGRPPFDPDDPALVNAFHHGAIGPDFGYIPGGTRVLSQLSHCVLTGRLTRRILRLAETPVERAFAAGWLTHVVADLEIHPLIGLAVGELVLGDRERFLAGAAHPLAHLRVELGLDCRIASAWPQATDIRLTNVFDDDSIGFLEGAYASTYGVAIPTGNFLESHRAVTRRINQSLSTLWIISALMQAGPAALGLCSLRRILGAAYASSPLRGVSLAYLNPVVPSEWLAEATIGVFPFHTERVLDLLHDDASRLDDFNLDTGRRLADEDGHPGVEAALGALRELAGCGGRTIDSIEVPAVTPRGPIHAREVA